MNESPVIYNIVQEDCAHLPAEVLVVRVTHVETLGGEGVGLNLHIGSRDLVDEAGLADVRESCRRQSINILMVEVNGD